MTCGLPYNMNLLSLALLSFLLSTGHGASVGPSSWNRQSATCVVCHKLLLSGAGLFCANYGHKRGVWTPCRQAWCGPCYTGHHLTKFPIFEPNDEDGDAPLQANNTDRFLTARAGGHLLCPFQCDLCHFCNIQGRDPLATKPTDSRLLRGYRLRCASSHHRTQQPLASCGMLCWLYNQPHHD